MSFIKTLGQNHHHYAVLFATWRGVSSGIAFWQMGKALTDKGFELAGAANAIGSHSMMFDETDPIGQDCPNSQDDDIAEQMVAKTRNEKPHTQAFIQ